MTATEKTVWREARAGAQSAITQRSLADLRQLVNDYNDAQVMACTGLRMDPHTPCNGCGEHLCMQCPRKKCVVVMIAAMPG